MFIFDKYESIINAVNQFDKTYGLQENIDHWIEYRGLPEACRNAFFEGEIGSYLTPEEEGGSAYPLFERVVCVEQLSRCAGATLPFLSELTDYALLTGLKAYLPDYDNAISLLPMKGKRPVFSEAFTEPSFFEGIDTLTTEVTRDGSGRLLLNGHKTFVPNGEFEETVLVLARDSVFGTEDNNTSLWLVPLASEGVLTAPIITMGQSILAPADVVFENVNLENAHRIEADGKLSLILRRQYELRCLFMAAVNLGLARAAFDDAENFLRRCRSASLAPERTLPVKAAMQDMRVSIEAMELFVQNTARTFEGDSELDSYFACKSLMHFVPKHALDVCERSMRILGLHGYSEGVRMGRILKDCRGNFLRKNGEEIMLSVLTSMFK